MKVILCVVVYLAAVQASGYIGTPVHQVYSAPVHHVYSTPVHHVQPAPHVHVQPIHEVHQVQQVQHVVHPQPPQHGVIPVTKTVLAKVPVQKYATVPVQSYRVANSVRNVVVPVKSYAVRKQVTPVVVPHQTYKQVPYQSYHTVPVKQTHHVPVEIPQPPIVTKYVSTVPVYAKSYAYSSGWNTGAWNDYKKH